MPAISIGDNMYSFEEVLSINSFLDIYGDEIKLFLIQYLPALATIFGAIGYFTGKELKEIANELRIIRKWITRENKALIRIRRRNKGS